MRVFVFRCRYLRGGFDRRPQGSVSYCHRGMDVSDGGGLFLFRYDSAVYGPDRGIYRQNVFIRQL